MSRHLPIILALALPTALLGCPGGGGGTSQAKTEKTAKTGEGKTGLQPRGPKPPFDRGSAKTPWADVKVGDWAEYLMVSRDKTLRFEVTALGDSTVTVDGPSGEMEIDLYEEESRYQEPTSYDGITEEPKTETVDVNGKEVEVLVVKRQSPRGDTSENWFAEETVPPFMQCTVKSMRNGSVEYELIDFGRGE